MEKLKKYSRVIILSLGAFMVYLFSLVILNYFQIMKYNSIIKINFIVVAVITFFLGLISGRATNKKGYLEGLKQGFVISFLLFVLNLIFYRHFGLNIFIYYFIIIVSSTFGSMIGINLKKN